MISTPQTVTITKPVGTIEVTVPPDLSIPGRGGGRASAYVDGYTAYAKGDSRGECPYQPGPGAGSFWVAWQRGFNDAEEADAKVQPAVSQ